jgi:hypothetical protein
VLTEDSAALSAWYGSRPEIHWLLAIRNTQGLRVRVHVERAHDSNEVHPAWMANRDAWIDELQLLTGDAVRLEHVDESLAAGVESDARDAIVAALPRRDPSFF